jgi:general secretion pathway protein J
MRAESRGFTLLELVIAMTVLGMVTVALYGVVAIGASAAGAGERKTEQARRFRTAVTVMSRQLRSVAPLFISGDKDEEPKPFFVADDESIEFITAAPQGPYAVGLAIVSYWLQDGKLFMSELPYFLAYDEDGLDEDADALKLETVLLYDVKALALSYQRSEGDEDGWEDAWDASDEDSLPAVVRMTVEPETPDGPSLVYEVPVYVGVFNAITGEEDFEEKRVRAAKATVPKDRMRDRKDKKDRTPPQDEAADEADEDEEPE